MTRLFKLVVFVFLLTQFIGCASMQDEVVQTMEGKDRPEWASMGKTVFSKGGKLYAVGMAEASGSARISSMLRISGNHARHEISRIVVNDLNYIYQNVQEGVDQVGELSRFYGSEVSGYMAQSIYPVEYYWEKVLVTTGYGEKELRFRAYSLIYIKESKLKKAIHEVVNKKKQLSPELKKKIDEHMGHQVNKLMQG